MPKYNTKPIDYSGCNETITAQQQPSLYIRCASCGDILRVMRGDLPSTSAAPVVLIEPCESCVANHRLECYRIGLEEAES